MIFQSEANYYEVLELRPDASAQDVRNAYLRLKASYRKDNPALYSVLDPGETEDMIGKIEEAFQVLSDPDARREYDERHGFADRIERKIFAIDRQPAPGVAAPMESGDGADPLVAPPTDFEGMSARGETTLTGINSFRLPTQPPRETGFLDTLPPTAEKPPVRSKDFDPGFGPGFIERRQGGVPVAPTRADIDPVATEVANETEWRGSTLRRIRELRRYSLDDVASLTKISRTHLLAIEEESFSKLPAPVFVRGFLLQISRTLKIPAEPVAIAYLARLSKRNA